MVDLGANLRNYRTDLHRNFRVELCKGLINLASLRRSPKGRCHGNQLELQNRRFSRKKILFFALPFRNGLDHRNANGQLRSRWNWATSCANDMMIGAVTPKKRLLIFVLS